MTQEFEMVDGTLFDNIAYGRKGVSKEELYQVSKEVGLHDKIMSLPNQYNTQVKDFQTSLSQGQKQRLAIARALLKKANILVLDEPSASLDLESENIINNLLFSLKGKCTIIVVTHRQLGLEYADQIFVLDKGQIVEQGSYEDLLQTEGAFLKICENRRLGDQKVKAAFK